jgi:restriction endonuclease S subunit
MSIDNDGGSFPVYGGNGLRGYTSEFTHDGDLILLGRQGAWCGNIHFANGRFWASEHAVVVTPKPDISVRWLGEVLRAMYLGQYSQTAAQPGLSVQFVENLSIPFPTFSEQRAIAGFLDGETTKIDTLVKKKERLIELLQEKRTALISHAVTKGLNPAAPLKDSGIEWLGEIPAHWEVSRIGTIYREVVESGNDSYGVADFRLRLYWDHFKNIRIALPDKTEQQQICQHIDSIVSKSERLAATCKVAIERLREYRTALISAAVTGKIDVRGAAASTPTASHPIAQGNALGKRATPASTHGPTGHDPAP